jgi:hypothetical protein
MKYLLAVLFDFFLSTAFSQTGVVRGTLLDSRTLEPLPFANIYINNTSIGTTSDAKGSYELKKVPVGQSDIVVSYVGYQSYKRNISVIERQEITLNIKLVSDEKLLESVQVKGSKDKEWNRQIKRFSKAFFGLGKNATDCKILNPWVLEFSEANGHLTAVATNDLEIENDALGYKIFYALKKFVSARDGTYSILGTVRYEEMNAVDKSNSSKWARNRLQTYNGSPRHFFKSILEHKIYQNGFEVYKDKVGFENTPRKDVFASGLGRIIEKVDTNRLQIIADPLTRTYTITLPRRIEVHFSKSIARDRIYIDVAHPVSWIDFKTGLIKVNSNGAVLTPDNMVTSGYMSSLRVGYTLPNNYDPNATTTIYGNAIDNLSTEFTNDSTMNLSSNMTGVVVNLESGKSLSNVDIFLNKTSKATHSDATGRFQLRNVPAGYAEIIAYKDGYEISRTPVAVSSGNNIQITVSLRPATRKKFQKLADEEITSAKEAVFGKLASNQWSRVLNPEILDINLSNGTQVLTASSPLVVQNTHTGYKLNFYLMGMSPDMVRQAPTRFEYLPTSKLTELIAAEKGKKLEFKGSARHFFQALANDEVEQYGYEIHDSSGNEIGGKSLLSTSKIAGNLHVPARGKLIIYYHKEENLTDTSFIDMSNPIEINREGVIFDEANPNIEGRMTRTDFTNMIPYDYRPVAGEVEEGFAEMLRWSFEKIYIQTDKPYYYQGERIWLKTYVNYYYPNAKDEMSRTMYLELINSQYEILVEKIIRLDSGVATADIRLPDTIKSGAYYLRAYTQLQRNFGDANLYVKPFHILQLKEKVKYINQNEKAVASLVQITTDKPSYSRKEKVNLRFDLTGPSKSANFSIAVTDMSQVLPIPEKTILEGYPISKSEIDETHDFKYPAEYGLTIKGKFKNNRGEGEKTLLNVIQVKPYQVTFVDTNINGDFQINNLNFYDESFFTMNSSRNGGKAYGKCIISKRETPAIATTGPDEKIETVSTESTQRIFSEYEKPRVAILLDEVEIRAGLSDELRRNANQPFRQLGEGEYVFDETRIKGQFPNLLYTLQSLNISGLVVNPNEQTVYFARHSKPVTLKLGDQAAADLAKTYTPMVTLDGTILMGSAGEALSLIPPSTIGTIEVTKSASTIRGTLAPYGVIALFTKKGISTKPNVVDLDLIKLQGYSTPDTFKSPDYRTADTNNADYRSTLHWNPNLQIKKGAPLLSSFYTSGLSGRYRIVLEGVDDRGFPFRGVTFINVQN